MTSSTGLVFETATNVGALKAAAYKVNEKSRL
jgi:hypothetical protein